MPHLPVYVINLDRRPERWRTISDNLARLGLSATRIAAVDGKLLAGDPAARSMGPGHVGCARSHYKAYAAFLATPHPAALILEDDAELGAAVCRLLDSAAWWPGGHGLVKAASSIEERARYCLGRPAGYDPCGRPLRPILRKALGAYGYLIDRETAGRILEIAPEIPVPIDHLLFNMVDSPVARRARPLQQVPGSVRHRPWDVVGSDTGSAGDARLKNAFGRKPWKANEIVRLRYKSRWAWALLTGKAARICVPYSDA